MSNGDKYDGGQVENGAGLPLEVIGKPLPRDFGAMRVSSRSVSGREMACAKALGWRGREWPMCVGGTGGSE